MWEPEPGWQRLAGGLGSATGGVWLVGDQVVKRFDAPHRGDPPELSDRTHFAYWRRAVEVAVSGLVEHTPGVRGQPATRVEEDPEGACVWYPHLDSLPPGGPFVARALGRFAGARLPPVGWLARDQLADRLRRVERRGGWPTLARTTAADVADVLWRRRGHYLEALTALPAVPQHGDPTPQNLMSHDADSVIAVDWATLGIGPVGADLGYYCLSAREDFGSLLEEYVAALPPGLAAPEQAGLGARVCAVYTMLSRAEWALARAGEGSGALAGKYRHPSVAPYLHSLQRHAALVEELL